MLDKDTVKILCQQFDVTEKVVDYVGEQEKKIENLYKDIDSIRSHNQFKVLNAMQQSKINATHFNWTTGYGYDDVGREKVEEVFSRIFGTEDALVRPTIVSGTHALTILLSGILRPGDEILSITGAPYDTLQKVIGIKGNSIGNLKEYGINYRELELSADGQIKLDAIAHAVNSKTKIILIQRSTGYSSRKAISIDEIEKAINVVKNINENLICMVDNCYGEFVEKREPTDVGADIMAGSLIKNPGGGLALTGGYIVGKKYLVEMVSNRSTAPGIGKECGLTFGTTRTTLQGLFLAPYVVSQALKTALLTCVVFKSLGFKVIPDLNDKRSDIIQSIQFGNKEGVIEFCQGIQAASPVDAYVVPEPWDMPGYEEPVIMAAGAFIQGSSIELSADGPIREPYTAYLQGGLTYDHGKLGVIKALDNLNKSNLLQL